MKMTVESFEEKVKQFESKREQISKDISDLAKEESRLAEECKAAVAAGDVDTYINLNRQKEDVSSALFVKRSFLDNMGKAATPEDATQAWMSFVSGYDKEMKKALEDFEAEKRVFLGKYKALIEMQNAALKTRDRINEIVSLPESSFPMTFIPCLSGTNTPGIIMKGGYHGDPDLIYYMANIERNCGRMLFDFQAAETKEANAALQSVARHIAK